MTNLSLVIFYRSNPPLTKKKPEYIIKPNLKGVKIMKFNVISFNIRYTNDPDGHSIQERAPRLKQIISQHDPDLIGFQECRPRWWPYIYADYSKDYGIFNRYRAFDESESSPILWKKDKFECVDSGYFWLSDTPTVESRGWDETGCYRMCAWVNLKHKESGKIFTFMNTHFGFGEKCQLDSVELIHKYNLEISDYPTLITGDFNMSRRFPSYERITSYYTDVNAATVNDTRNTYHGYKTDRPEYGPIDYCFVNEGFKPLHHERLDQTFDGKFPSDHYGIRMELELL